MVEHQLVLFIANIGRCFPQGRMKMAVDKDYYAQKNYSSVPAILLDYVSILLVIL